MTEPSSGFLRELEAFQAERLSPILGAGRASLDEDAPADAARMLQIALANELNVSELAAAWMPTTPEVEVKIAFARQAGDEAGHFQLVAARLAALGFAPASLAFCARRGDDETVRIYREYIQPDERAHQQLGRQLLDRYAVAPAQQRAAREAVARVLEIATATRAKAAEKLGAACFPGC